jgi:hypothetical protein
MGGEDLSAGYILSNDKTCREGRNFASRVKPDGCLSIPRALKSSQAQVRGPLSKILIFSFDSDIYLILASFSTLHSSTRKNVVRGLKKKASEVSTRSRLFSLTAYYDGRESNKFAIIVRQLYSPIFFTCA